MGVDLATMISRQHALIAHEVSLIISAKMAAPPRSRMRIANGCKQVPYLHLMVENQQFIFAKGIPAECLISASTPCAP